MERLMANTMKIKNSDTALVVPASLEYRAAHGY
jgi:hypothetical protein